MSGYDRDALVVLARAVVLQAARDYAQGLVQRRYVRWHDPEALRAWLTEHADYYGDADAKTLIRRIEDGAVKFKRLAAKVRKKGDPLPCPICGGTISRRKTSRGTIFARCTGCGVSVRYGR